MKDDKELNVINNEKLEDVNAGRMSKAEIGATVAGGIVGLGGIAAAIGVPVSKHVKKKKDKAKAKAEADYIQAVADNNIKSIADAWDKVKLPNGDTISDPQLEKLLDYEPEDSAHQS